MTELPERLNNGETVLGCFLNLGSPLTAEMVGQAGFDFVVIDLEHGSGTEADVLHQLQALEHTGTKSVIRVEGHERQRSHRVLDLGAHGIMFPRVNSAAEAEVCVAAMQYPPHGVRGVASMNRAAGFGVTFKQYVAEHREKLLGVVQVETVESVEKVDEIAAVDGADVLFIGPLDLTTSLGILGQFDHPDFIDALKRTDAAAKKHGKTTGILMPNPDFFERFYELGYRFLACGSDGAMVNNAARAMYSTLEQKKNAS